MFIRTDPGPCPICGRAHTACTAAGAAPVAVPQLPARDAAGAVSPRLEAERVQESLPEGQFTTGTYRRKPKR